MNTNSNTPSATIHTFRDRVNKKYETVIAAALAAGYEVSMWESEDGAGTLNIEHPDNRRRDILDSDKDGTLYYIKILPWSSDVARHYNRNTCDDQRTSVATIVANLKEVAA